jgi:SAM-dependent methyltransferase
VDEELRSLLDRSGYDRSGFAADYDRYRPSPPQVLRELLPQLAGAGQPRLVVDLGSGSGLSTRFWAESAEEVVGVEPQEAMRRFAEQRPGPSNVRYVDGSSYATGLPDAFADIVTAAQSLQWMQPKRALPEVGRILRKGGVFCAYNYVVLQTPGWEAETSFHRVRERTRELLVEFGLGGDAFGAPSAESLAESGVFRHTRELLLHSVEEGDGDRLVGFALSEGSTRTVLDAGASEADIGLDQLRAVAAAMPQPVPWWIGYRAWVGLK